MDASREIEDPTDWLNTSLADFLALDNALRCQVCKDFYDTPMITSCSHTFCSKCIRTCISNDGKCPTCRAAEQASKLRNNLAIEEAVGAFKLARPSAYRIALKDKEDEAGVQARPGKRRRISHEGGMPEAENGRRQTRSMRGTRSTAAPVQTDGAVEIVDSDGDGDYTPEDGLVACPICSTRMREQDVSPHLDGECDGTKKEDKVPRKSHTPVQAAPAQRQPSRPTPPSKPQDRLAELNYTLMNDNQLRKKFQALGIPATGRKELLKDRYTAWANIWNANCDSSHPKTKTELLNELRKWERTQGGQAKEGDSAGIMKKDFDAAGWQTNNKDDFSRLIAQARQKREKKATSTPTETAENASSPPEQTCLEAQDIQAMDMDPTPNASSLTQDLSDPTPPTAQRHPRINGSGGEGGSGGYDPSRPYENNLEAISSIRDKVAALNADKHIEPLMNEGFKVFGGEGAAEEYPYPPSGQKEATPVVLHSSGAKALRNSTRSPVSSAAPESASASASASSGGGGSEGRRSKEERKRNGAVRGRVPGLRNESSLGEHFADGDGARKMNMFRVPEAPVSDNEEAH